MIALATRPYRPGGDGGLHVAKRIPASRVAGERWGDPGRPAGVVVGPIGPVRRSADDFSIRA